MAYIYATSEQAIDLSMSVAHRPTNDIADHYYTCMLCQIMIIMYLVMLLNNIFYLDLSRISILFSHLFVEEYYIEW